MAPQIVQIQVQGDNVEFPKLGHRKAKGWRKQLEEKIRELTPLLSAVDPAVLRKVDLTKTEELEKLFSRLFELVEGSLDSALDLVIEYGKDTIGERRDKIEEDIYDEEIVVAFLVVVRAAVPFDQLRAMFVTISGPADLTTSQNGSGANTASPTTQTA